MKASVIIPNLDSPVVDRAVRSVLAQTGAAAHEIIVVGRDGPGRLAGVRGARLLVTERPEWPAGARNRGIQAASGDVYVFIDADCEAEPGWLAAHLARHAAGETVVGGAVLWDVAPYWQLADNLSMFHNVDAALPAGPRPYLPTLNLSVRAAAVDDVGAMDPGLRCGEDIDWTIRLAAAGHRSFLEPAARVWHRPTRTTARDMWWHWYMSGRWMVGVRRRHPDSFGSATWLYRPLALYLLAPAIAAAATARLYGPGRPGRRHPLTLPAVYATKLAWCFGAARPAL